MNIDFNKKNKSGKVRESVMQRSDYEGMLKSRKEHLPHLQKGIQEIFKDYDGTSMAIIIVKEDENGLPVDTQVLMGGVARPVTQMYLGKALTEASKDVMNLLLEGASGDVDKLLSLVKDLEKLMKDDGDE